MPYRFLLHREQKVACFRFERALSLGAARQTFVDYVRAPGLGPSHVLLTDARSVTDVNASIVGNVTSLQGLAADLRHFDKGGHSVILVNNRTTFGMVRMLERVLDFMNRVKIRLAWTAEEALALAG